MTLYRYARRFIDSVNQYRWWIDPRVRTLRLAEVIAYLRRRGWVEEEPDRPGFRVFREPSGADGGGQVYHQFMPDSEVGSDYPLRMFELLTGLAEVEKRPAAAVIDDILRRSGDGNGAAEPSQAAEAASSPSTRK
jgi:hypothetical protein